MSGDVALVTGGARGLGAAIARRLRADGMRVAVADIDTKAAQALAAELDPSGDNATAVTMDVREESNVLGVRDSLLARWGSVQVLVNNAVVTRATPVLDITAAEFDAVLAVNVRGTFLASQLFGRLFKAEGYGRIINLASLAGQNGGTSTGAHYAASKGAIITLTKVFARELAPFGVTVNAIAPGPLDLPSVREIVPKDALSALERAIPTGGLGNPAFVAAMVALCASRDAGFATGSTWDVNGGLYMR